MLQVHNYCNVWIPSLTVDYVNGGELFTHLNQHEQFTEDQVRVYIGEIVLALENLHKVRWVFFPVSEWLNLLAGYNLKMFLDFDLS